MAVFRCKMCGASIKLDKNETVGICEHCLTEQTFPKLDDEKRESLYDRANHFRRNNDYDKAMGIYEKILLEDPEDSEAYWSVVLCNYGVEYVEDPVTRKRIPTVNRTQYTSIYDDDNYRSALRFADISQKCIYEREAEQINEIQRKILSISKQEEPFDIFICYKETDNSGKRTPDSVLATEIYHQLTNEGFKVFFSRITLESKIGTEYEPYIFAALNSAKIMIVLGTRPEYFNAVWVKNEWSRFLSLIKTSKGNKLLIPAYKDMDPYELPEEFSHLQALDMAKLGFVQDLLHGIKKVLNNNDSVTSSKQSTIGQGSNTASLLKRVFIVLEDGDFDKADSLCEQVLNTDPENALAYLGKLMSELHVKTRDELGKLEKTFDDNKNFSKIIRFGDDELKKLVNDSIASINSKNENERKNRIYIEAVGKMEHGATKTEILAALKLFDKISGYKDADDLAKQCIAKADEVAALNKKCDELYTQLLNAAKCRKRMDLIHSEIAELRSEIEKSNTTKNNLPKLKAELASLEEKIKELSRRSTELTLESYHLGFFAKSKKLRLQNEAAEMLREKKVFEDQKADLEKRISRISSAGSSDISDNEEAIRMLEKDLEAAKRYDSIVEELSKCDYGKQLLEKANDYLNRLNVGKIIRFGSYLPKYCQTKDGTVDTECNSSGLKKQDIEWLILDKDATGMLVISKYAVDEKDYSKHGGNNWEDSSIRKWLNSDFYNKAFTGKERALIRPYAFAGALTDKVFLLSVTQAEGYFINNDTRICSTSSLLDVGTPKCDWWLRDVVSDGWFATYVDRGGRVNRQGTNLGLINFVRPVMWIDTKAYDKLYDSYNSIPTSKTIDDGQESEPESDNAQHRRSSYNVRLVSHNGNRLTCVRAMRAVRGCGLDEAIKLTDTPAVLIAEGVSEEAAEQIKREFEKEGVTVAIE